MNVESTPPTQPQIPARNIKKVDGSGAVPTKVVFGSAKVTELEISPKPSWTKVPGIKVGADVVPVSNGEKGSGELLPWISDMAAERIHSSE